MMRKWIMALTMSLMLLSLVALPSQAITYGTPDGNGHPNVGVMLADTRGTGQLRALCSGTLISPTVFLTASHCTAYVESLGVTNVAVSFDSVYSTSSLVIPGTMYTNPNYRPAQSDPGDIAVIVLSQPVTWLTPAKLPPAGLFDQMHAQNGLRDQSFVAVGYGVHEPVVGAGGVDFPFTSDRWVSVSSYDALNPAWLRLSQNNATGDGGTCFGDSGGPNFLGDSDMLAGITITGDSMCLATNVIYRLDFPGARDFLSQFVTLP